MKYSASFLKLVFVLLALSGCASTGAFDTAHLTEVQLSEANYDLVATNVTGKAAAAYLIGASGIVYGQMQTIALVRVSGSGLIYGEAIENLWENFQEQHGEAEGRTLALVNVRYDTDALNLILYTRPMVSVRADVVEFTGD